ncbi:MAG: dephospho-CoA kinase [Rubripirellula sp.]
MIVLGIVGSPAGGKSTVAKYLQELGATWINADLIAREVLEEDAIQAQVLGHFGSEIAGKDGRIDRSLLADRVFGDDDEKRAELNYMEGLIHPRTRRIITNRLRELEQQQERVAILDVPLLFKSGWDKSCDEIWCVDSDRKLRLMRIRGRGWDDGELRARESNQLDIREKRRLSTTLIMNNGTLRQLHGTIDQLWSSLLKRYEGATEDQHCGE